MKDAATHATAIISGGAGYIGCAIAKTLSQNGWRVAVLSRPGAERADAETYACDITDEENVREVVEEIVSRYGPIRACIHAAASPLERKPMLSLSREDFVKPVSVALRGAFLLAKAAVPHMSPGSVFIGITTEGIERGATQAKMGSYIPAKYALRGFLRALAEEVRSKHIRVNAVAPGFLPSGLNRDLPKAMADFLAEKSNARSQTPDDVAKLITKLCVDENAFPSGTSILVSNETVSSL